MSLAVVITVLTYLVGGALPPVIAYYAFGVRFLGGIWLALAIGVFAAAVGSVLATLAGGSIPDLVVVAGAVDLVPPVVMSIAVTLVYSAVSRSNPQGR